MNECSLIGKFRLHLLLLAIVSAQQPSVVNAAAREQAAGAIALSPCKVADVAQPARCGVLDVPENPDQPDGRRLAINVVVIPATSTKALPDPIVVLMGGPGEDAMSVAGIFADQFAPLRNDRDLLLVDQRGTGRSAALRCELYSADDPATSLRHLFPPAAVERCARELRSRADLTRYSFAYFTGDLESARRALGYGQLNLFAGSYGTRAAQVYLRAHPQSVRTAYLGSVVPIDVPSPLPMAQSAQAAMESTLSACEADSACNTAFPNLREEFRQIIVRLESGAVRVSVSGHAGRVPMHRGRVAEWFRSQLYRPEDAAVLPWMIHRAYAGDWSPIAAGILTSARELPSALSLGLFFSITCNEDVAFIREEEIQPRTQGTFLGDYRVREQQAACKNWPKAELPAQYRMPVRSSAPTLFISGDTDGGSPLWFTEHVAAGFSNRAEIVLRGRGHTQWSDCVGKLYERLVRSGAARGLDASTCETVPRPPFKTE